MVFAVHSIYLELLSFLVYPVATTLVASKGEEQKNYVLSSSKGISVGVTGDG